MHCGFNTKVKKILQKDGRRRHDIWIASNTYKENEKLILQTLEGLGYPKTFIKQKKRRYPTVNLKPIQNKRNSIKAITFNINGFRNKSEEVYAFLDRRRPDILAMQETLLSEERYRTYIPGYTTIEAKMTDREGGRGLLLSVRNNRGLRLSEYKSDPNYLAGIIEGLDMQKEKFSMLIINVYASCDSKTKRQTIQQVCRLVERELQRQKFKEIIMLGDWNDTPEKTYNRLTKQGMAFNDSFINFRQPTRFVRRTRRGRCID
ncbi:Apurinic/apyrimidinic endonuclease [Trachipleistophora hominis]|uniref:Apurinic/apyrimidinic endonuclease n=1 Tax=Trachipleistophora hominis TaxID=72359 RepID=L7JSC8_TRAHO|nr:Apurinic/apyrimidinic endonuclease [Trachipleistophora hominis]